MRIDDRRFEPRRAVGVDDVGQRLRGVADDLELALQDVGALVELVFVDQPGVEALEIGPVPKDVRLFLDRDAARDAVLREQRLADELAASRGGGTAACRSRRAFRRTARSRRTPH